MMNTLPKHTIRGAVSAAALASLLAWPGAASAIPDPGPTGSAPQRGCSLERIETQLVRCDNLTGAGAHAPGHIPVQGAS